MSHPRTTLVESTGTQMRGRESGRPLLYLVLVSFLTLSCTGAEAKTELVKEEKRSLPKDVAHLVDQRNPEAEPATTAVGETGAASPIFATTGEFISPSRSHVAPKIPGRVAAVHVDAGATVKQGQPLATFETEYDRLELQRLEAELQRLSAIASEAARDYERKKELRGRESIPQARYDQSLAALEQANAAKASAAAGVAIAKQRVADKVLRAPFSGVIAERRINVGEFVGDGGATFVIQQTAPLELRFSLPESHLGRIREGAMVSVTVAPYPAETFTGTIRTIGGVIDPATRSFFAVAEFPNADGRLRPGLFARVELKLD
jgi:membrane fusion protein, multidrug efflux system